MSGRPDTLVAACAGCAEAIAQAGDPERADKMAAYMKDHFVFAGVKATPRRELQRPVIAATRGLDPDQILAAIEWCWTHELREVQYLGLDLARKHAGRFQASDLDRILALIRNKSWWDTVDSLAAHTVGAMVTNHPQLGSDMDRWIVDPDMWVVRSAILHQLTYKDRTDPGVLFGYALRRASDTEFFIRKAIGWALRAYARVDPDGVWAFVDSNRDRFSGLTIREATKHL